MTSPYKWIKQQSAEPAGPTQGDGWIDIDHGSAYVRLGSHWIPFAGSGAPVVAAPLYSGIQYFVNLKNQSAICKRANIKDQITVKVDTANFVLQDSDGTEKPVNGHDVTIFQGDTFTKIFGGIITAMPQKKMGYRNYFYNVRCADYSKLLDKQLAVEVYTGQTVGYIVKDLIDNYFDAGEFSYDNVQDGPIRDKIVFNYKSIGNCFKELARLSGMDWYVDYDRDIHFFARETNSAPYELNEAGTSGEYNGLSIDIDSSQLVNKVIVRGGYYLSGLYTQEIVADGEQLEFLSAYTPQSPIKVYVSAVEKTLGIDNIDIAGKDFLVNVTEKTFKNLDHALLGAGDVFKMTYKYKVPIIVVVEDYEGQQVVAAIEGGDGIHKKIIVEEEIATLEAARDRAIAEQAQYGNAIIKGSFKTSQNGYRSGQLLTVNLPSRGIVSDYLVQTVTKKSLGRGLMEYTIMFATLLTGLTDFFLSLWDDSRKVVVREDEVPDELLSKEESLVLSHSVPALEEFTPPFQFGPGGSPQGKFNESQFT